MHVGTAGLSTLSSSSIDQIPEKIRRIFDETDTDKWVIVFYLTKHSEIIARVAFFYEGHDRVYKETCESAVDGSLARVVVVFKSKSVSYTTRKSHPVKDLKKGERFLMTIRGEIIP